MYIKVAYSYSANNPFTLDVDGRIGERRWAKIKLVSTSVYYPFLDLLCLRLLNIWGFGNPDTYACSVDSD